MNNEIARARTTFLGVARKKQISHCEKSAMRSVNFESLARQPAYVPIERSGRYDANEV